MNEAVRISDYDSLIREVLATGGEFRLYPHGTSMLPLIRQGVDSVALRSLDGPVKKQDILFYRRSDGSYVLHRVKSVGRRGIVLWGDNQHVLEYGVTEDQIIGRVARIFRADHEINCRSFKYRAYLWLWQFIVLRKIVLYSAYFLRKEIDSHA